MLSELHIENIALIDRLDMSLSAGFNVLTGETGAGKSIIIDAVNLVLGERADKDLIKSGQDRALVEAVFELRDDALIRMLLEMGIETEDSLLILSRELSVSGRNVCRINGRLVSSSMLKDASDFLVDVHGQHEHQHLLRAQTHIDFLDVYDKRSIAGLKKKLAELFKQWHELVNMLEKKIGSAAERARKIDTLTFEIEEIESAQLKAGEEETLSAERVVMMDAERIQSALGEAVECFNGSEDIEQESAMALVKRAVRRLESIAAVNENFSNMSERLNECYYTLEDVCFDMQRLRDDSAFDPYRYEQIEARLDELERLKRKYGESIEEAIAYGEKRQRELDEVMQMADLAERGLAKKRELEKEVYTLSQALSTARREAAKKLETDMLLQLKDLGMEKTQFEVSFAPFPEFEEDMTFYENGLDTVEMLLSPNPGEPLKPLRKIASGGEMSRIMLAFKSIAAESGGCSALIFDEIDTGVSGRISSVVGEKMWAIGRNHQVICVTHSPQIAAMADAHFLISKIQEDDKTVTSVQRLNDEDHVLEVARIAGGAQTSEQTVSYARDLVQKARNRKTT